MRRRTKRERAERAWTVVQWLMLAFIIASAVFVSVENSEHPDHDRVQRIVEQARR